MIGINRNDSQTRRRFTLAHEFKHILDHPFIDTIYSEFFRGNEPSLRVATGQGAVVFEVE